MIVTRNESDNTNGGTLDAANLSNRAGRSECTEIPKATLHFRTLFPERQEGYAIVMFNPVDSAPPLHRAIALDDENPYRLFWNTVKPFLETHDCYVAPATFRVPYLTNERTTRREYRTKQMVSGCRWAFLDRDRHVLDDRLPPPTLTIETSAGSFQDFWHLDQTVDVEVIEDLNRRIAFACGCGFQAIDAVHVLRIVGTRNLKPTNNREIVRLVQESNTIYALRDFGHLPMAPATPPVRRYMSDGERPKAPVHTAADTALMKKAWHAKNSAAFRKLFRGDTSDYGDDHSRADLAFCCHLADWTDCNEEQIDRIFRDTPLYRDKWERDDYREATITKAIAWIEEGRASEAKSNGETNEGCPTPPTAVDDENVAAFDKDWRPSGAVAVDGVSMTRLSDVMPERVSWLWKGFIPLGKLTVLDGDPGLGKSTVTLDIAARVTRGQTMPDGTASGVDGPASVVLMSAEDGLADTILPRVLAAQGDASRVHSLDTIGAAGEERMPSLADDRKLEEVITRTGARLVIVDPLMAYLPASTNAHRDQDIRRVLAPLKEVAERTGAAILVVRHLNKGENANVLYRGGGSIGIIGAVRSGLIVAADPQDQTGTRRILAVQKMNVAAHAGSLAFRVEDNGEGDARIEWLGASSQTAATLFAPTENTERGQRGEAKAFLREVLSDGPLTANNVKEAAREAGISERTLERAKRELDVASVKQGFDAGFVWKLAPTEECHTAPRPPPDSEDRHFSPNMGEWRHSA